MPSDFTNLSSVASLVSAERRLARNRHRGGVLWFTGLPGSGKTTLAVALEQSLFDKGAQAYVLDGDRMRRGLSSDLGFSAADRSENVRRLGEVAAMFADCGIIVIVAAISPYIADRAIARVAGGNSFHEIHINAPVEVCEGRDPKGHYRKARSGQIPEFTGVTAPYEVPESPDLKLNTHLLTVEQCLIKLLEFTRVHLKNSAA